MREWSKMDAFIADTHGERHVLRNRELFDWFFLRNEDKNQANVVVAYHGDRLISLLGYLPTVFRWGDADMVGTWMAHWVTDDAYRHGIGALLMKRMTEMFPIVAGQGASTMNQAIVTAMKFRFVESIPKVVCIFNQASVLRNFDFPSQEVAFASAPAIPSERLTQQSFDPDWSLYPTLRFGTLRDWRYIKQRYVDYPFFTYQIYVAGPPHAPAVCVTRVCATTLGIKVGRILEFFYPETKDGLDLAENLLRQCLSRFQQDQCDYADFYCTSAKHIDLFRRTGFVPDDLGQLPSLLDPIDRSRKAQNLELFVSQDLKRLYPGCEDAFFATRADGDQDRPNDSFRAHLGRGRT